MLKVLFVTSRSADVRELLYKTRERWQVSTLRDSANAPQAIETGSYDIVLFDVALKGVFAPDLLHRICELPRHPPVFILSREYAFPFVNLALDAGVCDCFHIPYDGRKLIANIDRFLEAGSHVLSCDSAVVSGTDTACHSPLLGKSSVMEQLRASILAFRQRTDPVLIVGETGSGKDLVARMIHQTSPVSSGPYAILNVSCLTATLAESMLFGSVRGGFTDARDKTGIIEEAHRGTLFLDEIGELDLSLQPKLLRVLEDKRVTKVGSSKVEEVDFRLVCATNRNLAQAVESGHFREDLYYRIDALRLEIPPLREHPEDIPLLASFRLNGYGKILSHTALEKLHGYRWPGNVRQLFNCLARAACSANSEVIHPDQIRF